MTGLILFQVPDTLQPSVHPQDTTQPSVTTSDQSKMNIVMKDVSSNSQVQQLLSKYVAFKEISKDSTNESRIFFVARNQIFNNTKPEEDKTAVSAQAAIDTNDTSSQSKLNIVMKDVSRNSQVQQLLSKYIDPTDRSKDSANESKILLVARNQVSSSTKHEEAKTAVVAQDSSDTNAASDQSKLNIVMKDVSSNSQVQQLLSKYIEPKDGSRDTASESKVLLVARNQISNDAREDMSVVNAKASNDTDAQKNKVCNENNIGQGTAGRTKEVTKATAEETLTNKHLKKFDDRWKCGKKVGNVEDFENQLKECYTLPKYVHKVKIHETSENKSTNAQKKTDISNNKIVIEKSQKVFENRWKCEIKLGESSDFENSLKGFVYLGKSKSETEDLDDRADNNHKRSEKLHRKSESFKLKSQKEGKKTVITYSSSVQEQKTTTVAGKSKSVQESNETVPRDSNKSVKDHMKRRRMKRRCQKCKACLREKDCRKCSYCLVSWQN